MGTNEENFSFLQKSGINEWVDNELINSEISSKVGDILNLDLEKNWQKRVKTKESEKLKDLLRWLWESISWLKIDIENNSEELLSMKKQMFIMQEEIEKLTNIAYTDELTWLPNRRSAMEYSSIMIDYFKLWEISNLSFSILDIDYFKKVNDVYWHKTGDYLLQNFSKFLNSKLKSYSNSKIFRLWWEEFVIISELSKNDLKNILDESLNDFSQIKHKYEWEEFSVTFSWWIYEYSNDNNDLSEQQENNTIISESLHQADIKLYEAKQSWRARIKL